MAVMAPWVDREGHDHDGPPAHGDEDARDTVDERRMGLCVRARPRGRRRPACNLADAAHNDGSLGPAARELDFGGEHSEQPREVAWRSPRRRRGSPTAPAR
jgi:hypothetical protein